MELEQGVEAVGVEDAEAFDELAVVPGDHVGLEGQAGLAESFGLARGEFLREVQRRREFLRVFLLVGKEGRDRAELRLAIEGQVHGGFAGDVAFARLVESPDESGRAFERHAGVEVIARGQAVGRFMRLEVSGDGLPEGRSHVPQSCRSRAGGKRTERHVPSSY
mgnify:CR=1 FL=1